jgi:curli production assembly/transport component CsgG
MQFILLPQDKLSPYILEGFGMNKFRKSACQSSVQAGIEYMASANVGVKLYGEHNLNFSDNIDYIKEECEMIIIIVLDWV